MVAHQAGDRGVADGAERAGSLAMPDLDDGEKAALVELLRDTIAADPYPKSPRVRALRRVLDKLEPPPPRPAPYPHPKPAGEPSLLLANGKRPGRR